MERQGDVLRKPENHRYFVWTSRGLKLTGNPPKEVEEAWVALAREPKGLLARFKANSN